MTVKILGLDKLKRRLRWMGPSVREEVETAVLKGAQEVADMARMLAPEDSGALKRSIQARLGDPPESAKVFGRRGSKDKDSVRASAWAGDREAYYARWVEFGTAPHPQGGQFAGTQHPGNPPRPYFLPAYRANRKRARARITRAINKGIKRAIAR